LSGRPYSQTETAALRELIDKSRDALTADIAREFSKKFPDRSYNSVRCKIDDLRNAPIEPLAVKRVAESAESLIIESAPLGRITTLEQLLEAANVDLEKWEVERWIANKWEVGAADKAIGSTKEGWRREDTKIKVEPLWQVKAWLIPKGSKATLAELRDGLLADIAADTLVRARVRHKAPREVPEDRHMLEVCLMDLHIGKFAWGEETGKNYDSEIAETIARDAIDDLFAQAKGYPVEQIVLPLGNDYFHFDGLQGSTMNGTPQDRDTRYHKMFRRGRALASWMIEVCAERAPVKVVIVPGNHSGTTEFMLGEVLSAEFRHDSRVTIDNSPKLRKYHLYGRNLLGFVHGHEEPHDKLAQIMAVEVPDLWAQSDYREIHTGHFHKAKATLPLMVDDKTGVTVRILRSLSATDAWHYKKGYVGTPRSAEAFVWSATGGLRANLFHLIKAAAA